LKVAELIVRCLENEGVDLIYGLPGEENLELLEVLQDSRIRFIQTRHEQGAAFMADVFGRLTGRAGVCLSTLGPGATNLITGVADAFLDRAPVVALTGQVDRDRLHKESHQNIDLVEIMRPVTKWNTRIMHPPVAAEAVRKAFKVAQVEKPGPTHLDIPDDVAAEEVNEGPLPVNWPKRGEPAEREIERALEILRSARYPIIIAGNGVVRGQASDTLIRFAEAFEIPVVTTFMGKGVIPYTHPLALFTVGLQTKDVSYCGLDRADVVVSVGYDLVEYAPEFWNRDRDKRLIQIDTVPAEVDASYNVNVGLIGDIAASLRRLTEKAFKAGGTPVSGLRDLVFGELESFRLDSTFPLKPQKVVADMRTVLGDSDIVVSDVGAHKMWIARLYPCVVPNTCIISNGFAAMGIAVPGALAAKMLYPERRVLAATGDGGFLMNAQELETAVRVKAPFVTLVFRDNEYGLIRFKQMTRFKRTAYVDFGNPDLVRFAESFGLKGYRVAAASELLPILEDAFTQEVPSVIDCPVQYGTENLRLLERMGKVICTF